MYSDTGESYLIAAEAPNLVFPDRISTEMVNYFKEYVPPPFDLAIELYPPMAKVTDMWKLGHKLSDDPRRTRILYSVTWPHIRKSTCRLLNEHPYYLLVVLHPLPMIAIYRTLKPDSSHVITVVTDIVSTHCLWFNRRSELVLKPTEIARQNGLSYGLNPD